MPISPHIARLRALVGTETLQIPSVAVLPVGAGGDVLLVRHSDTGKWGILGGAIELDERPEDAARREVFEEVGLEVEIGRLLGAFGGSEYRVTYPNGDAVSYVVLAYEATVRSGVPVPDTDEVTDAAWFGPDEIAAAEVNPLARALLRETGLLVTAR